MRAQSRTAGTAIRAVVTNLAVLTLVAAPSLCARAEPPPPLPAGFVRLSEIAPAIRQDMRYARAFNFMGRAVPGYDAGQCILLRPAAEALLRAEVQLEAQGLALKVYDCYRPVRAVQAFAAWARTPGDDAMKMIFYPGFDKSTLFALGYIATRSRHSLGTAVDAGLVRVDDAEPAVPETGARCDDPFEQRARESTVDLGTAFDCFSVRSATASAQISAAARANRGRLGNAMEASGFRNYPREWWHFDYVAGTPPLVSRDFPVQ